MSHPLVPTCAAQGPSSTATPRVRPSHGTPIALAVLSTALMVACGPAATDSAESSTPASDGGAAGASDDGAAPTPPPAETTPSPTPHRSGPFGAIAVSADGTHAGISYDEPSRRDAEAVAVRQCEQSGKGKRLDCRRQLWFESACGALAMGDEGGFGTGWGKGPRRACTEALATCRNHRAANCEAMYYACAPGGPRGTCDGSLRSD